MKRIFAFSLILALAFCSCAPKKSGLDAAENKYDGYTLAFCDEFDDNTLDRSVWNYETGYIRNNEPQYYTDDGGNISFEDGCLVITARAENYTSADGETAKYTSACLDTMNNYSFKYGRAEIRAKLPVSECTACWPAFWMMGTDAEWPEGGEIDILEMYGVNYNRYECNIHWADAEQSNGYLGYINMMMPPYNTKISKTYDEPLGNAWHTYGIDWDENKMSFYFDDETIGSFDITEKNMSELHGNMYLLLNLALTKEGDKTPLDNGEELKYMIDYVRVYQKK